MARTAGVSLTLASLALNDRPGVSAEAKARVLAVAEQLGYRADPAARALRLGRTDTYGFVIRSLQNPFFLDVIAGMQAAAGSKGASVLAVDSDYSGERELEHIERLAAQRVAGIAIVPVGPGRSVRRWQELCPGRPTVVVNAVVEGVGGLSVVAPDNAAAIRLSVAHLAGLGHRRITCLTAPREALADHDRDDLFAAECAGAGVAADVVEVPFGADTGYAAVLALLRGPDRPTAVITNADFVAHAVYRAAREAGVAIGTELSVVGHDDLPTSVLLDPPLTTLRLDRHAFGRAVFERLSAGEGLDDHHEPVELVVRGSTGPMR